MGKCRILVEKTGVMWYCVCRNISGGIMENAKELLESGGYTCVITDGDRVLTSTLRGVKPLVQFLESGRDLTGFSAADKVVGRATAYLYVLLGVKNHSNPSFVNWYFYCTAFSALWQWENAGFRLKRPA